MLLKAEVTNQIIAHIEERIEEIDKAIEDRLEAMREAETRNQTRYDTKGWEAAREAEGGQRIRIDLERQRQFFLQLSQERNGSRASKKHDTIGPGSLVELKDEKGTPRWIFLVPCAGGIEIQDVLVVSTSATIAKQIISARGDGRVILQDGEYVIAQIQ